MINLPSDNSDAEKKPTNFANTRTAKPSAKINGRPCQKTSALGFFKPKRRGGKSCDVDGRAQLLRKSFNRSRSADDCIKPSSVLLHQIDVRDWNDILSAEAENTASKTGRETAYVPKDKVSEATAFFERMFAPGVPRIDNEVNWKNVARQRASNRRSSVVSSTPGTRVNVKRAVRRFSTGDVGRKSAGLSDYLSAKPSGNVRVQQAIFAAAINSNSPRIGIGRAALLQLAKDSDVSLESKLSLSHVASSSITVLCEDASKRDEQFPRRNSPETVTCSVAQIAVEINSNLNIDHEEPICSFKQQTIHDIMNFDVLTSSDEETSSVSSSSLDDLLEAIYCRDMSCDTSSLDGMLATAKRDVGDDSSLCDIVEFESQYDYEKLHQSAISESSIKGQYTKLQRTARPQTTDQLIAGETPIDKTLTEHSDQQSQSANVVCETQILETMTEHADQQSQSAFGACESPIDKAMIERAQQQSQPACLVTSQAFLSEQPDLRLPKIFCFERLIQPAARLMLDNDSKAVKTQKLLESKELKQDSEDYSTDSAGAAGNIDELLKAFERHQSRESNSDVELDHETKIDDSSSDTAKRPRRRSDNRVTGSRAASDMYREMSPNNTEMRLDDDNPSSRDASPNGDALRLANENSLSRGAAQNWGDLIFDNKNMSSRDVNEALRLANENQSSRDTSPDSDVRRLDNENPSSRDTTPSTDALRLDSENPSSRDTSDIDALLLDNEKSPSHDANNIDYLLLDNNNSLSRDTNNIDALPLDNENPPSRDANNIDALPLDNENSPSRDANNIDALPLDNENSPSRDANNIDALLLDNEKSLLFKTSVINASSLNRANLPSRDTVNMVDTLRFGCTQNSSDFHLTSQSSPEQLADISNGSSLQSCHSLIAINQSSTESPIKQLKMSPTLHEYCTPNNAAVFKSSAMTSLFTTSLVSSQHGARRSASDSTLFHIKAVVRKTKISSSDELLHHSKRKSGSSRDTLSASPNQRQRRFPNHGRAQFDNGLYTVKDGIMVTEASAGSTWPYTVMESFEARKDEANQRDESSCFGARAVSQLTWISEAKQDDESTCFTYSSPGICDKTLTNSCSSPSWYDVASRAGVSYITPTTCATTSVTHCADMLPSRLQVLRGITDTETANRLRQLTQSPSKINRDIYSTSYEYKYSGPLPNQRSKTNFNFDVLFSGDSNYESQASDADIETPLNSFIDLSYSDVSSSSNSLLLLSRRSQSKDSRSSSSPLNADQNITRLRVLQNIGSSNVMQNYRPRKDQQSSGSFSVKQNTSMSKRIMYEHENDSSSPANQTSSPEYDNGNITPRYFQQGSDERRFAFNAANGSRLLLFGCRGSPSSLDRSSCSSTLSVVDEYSNVGGSRSSQFDSSTATSTIKQRNVTLTKNTNNFGAVRSDERDDCIGTFSSNAMISAAVERDCRIVARTDNYSSGNVIKVSSYSTLSMPISAQKKLQSSSSRSNIANSSFLVEYPIYAQTGQVRPRSSFARMNLHNSVNSKENCHRASDEGLIRSRQEVVSDSDNPTDSDIETDMVFEEIYEQLDNAAKTVDELRGKYQHRKQLH